MAKQPPEIDVSDREQLEAALRDIAQQDGGQQNVVAFAVRNALRAISIFMALDVSSRPERTATILLPSLRATAATWIASVYQTDHFATSKSLAAAFNAAQVAENTTRAVPLIGEAAVVTSIVRNASAIALNGAALKTENVAFAALVAADSAFATAAAEDLVKIQHGATLSRQPLWIDHVPGWAMERWQHLKDQLQSVGDQNWAVWIDWYEARLSGNPTHPELSAAANERIELARVLEIEEDDWKLGPAHVNAKIKAIIERETDRDQRERNQRPANEDIPEPKPASVNVIWRSGKAYLDTSTLSADVAAKLADEEKQALCDEIRELIDAIADDVNYDITPRTYLEKTLGMFPAAAPTSAELLKLARRETTLTEFAASVNAEWPDFQAAHFRSVVSGLSAYLNLFPLRRERRRIDIAGVLEDVTGKEARQDIERTSEVLKTETGNLVVDKSIPNAIDDVAQEIPDTEEPLEGAAREAAVDAYDGINNTAIVIAKNAGDSSNARAVLAEIGAETPEEAEAFLQGRSEQRLQNFENLGRAEGNVETGYQVSSGIARNRKELFGWIKRLIKNWGR
jgi:hypothetical protein